MPRYFLEVAYNGKNYSGFQRQQNANTIQAETEKAIAVLAGKEIILTGSSRTDAGVHALQNYFHFDSDNDIADWKGIANENTLVYKLNAILPADICTRSVKEVDETAHCRFDAISREYNYYIYQFKNPFFADRAYYFPYRLDMEKLQKGANILKGYSDFTSFSKRNTQVKSFLCDIFESKWFQKGGLLVYNVKANRFLRGMIKGLTATLLKLGRGKMTTEEFKKIIEAKDCTAANFTAPAHGLFLKSVSYPKDIF